MIKNTLVNAKDRKTIFGRIFTHNVIQLTNKNDTFIAGIKVVYDLSKPNGKRVARVHIRCTRCDVPRFEELLLEKTYSVFMSTFMTNGGDGYSMVPQHARNIVPYGEREGESVCVRACVRAYVRTCVRACV